MRLYIGNLDFGVTTDQLRELFSEAGIVRRFVVRDRETGRSRGCAFVTMADDDAVLAIKIFAGASFRGRALRVNEAQPR
jgi:cold-inducible RNA-binding protein